VGIYIKESILPVASRNFYPEMFHRGITFLDIISPLELNGFFDVDTHTATS
jgi:hypothetical protein